MIFLLLLIFLLIINPLKYLKNEMCFTVIINFLFYIRKKEKKYNKYNKINYIEINIFLYLIKILIFLI